MGLQFVGHDEAVAEHDPPVRPLGQFLLVRHQQERGVFLPVQTEQQVQWIASQGRPAPLLPAAPPDRGSVVPDDPGAFTPWISRM